MAGDDIIMKYKGHKEEEEEKGVTHIVAAVRAGGMRAVGATAQGYRGRLSWGGRKKKE